jgi:UDP-2,4-diacetamido-2,4,6-trideoxy-beta-L-altropyranose hydrolase
MRFLIRTDASHLIGSGHVMRCRNLADALRARGADVRFACRAGEGDMSARLREEGYEVAPLDGNEADQSRDADATLAAIGLWRPDWVVVDHYELGAAWEARMRDAFGRVAAIDDLADRDHDTDVLIDQNFATDPPARYAFLSGRTRLLLGPRYAMMDPRYANAHPEPPTVENLLRRIVIYFGGADRTDMTGRVLATLSDPAFAGIALDVIAGGGHPDSRGLAAAAARRPRTTLRGSLPSLLPVLDRADLAIGAGGTTTWERLALGVPSILVSIAENQVPASEALDRAGMAIHLGREDGFRPEALAQCVRTLADAPRRRAEMALAGWLAVDGLGALRVAEVLMPTSGDRLAVRPARKSDARYLLDLANDPAVRQQSFSQRGIAWADHAQWLSSHLSNPTCVFSILEASGVPVGQIRFEIAGEDAVLNYALDPIGRGRGWGARLVTLGLATLIGRGVRRVNAEVKPGNAASRAVFEKLGFRGPERMGTDRLLYKRALGE